MSVSFTTWGRSYFTLHWRASIETKHAKDKHDEYHTTTSLIGES